MNAFLYNIPTNKKDITDDTLLEVCKKNPESRIERTFEGEIIVMPRTCSETESRNFSLGLQFGNWNLKKKLGILFDSSTAFKPKGQAIFSPDVAYIKI